MEHTALTPPVDLMREAEKLLSDVENTPAERMKKSIPVATDLQTFLLFARASGYVPKHQVKGPITVQTLIGHAQMSAEGNSLDLPKGSIVSFAADVPHDVRELTDSVLLVTHALPRV